MASFCSLIFIPFICCALLSGCITRSGQTPIVAEAGAAKPMFVAAELHATCPVLLAESDWKSSDLYTLTYQCIPPGWSAFFDDPKVKSQLRQISEELRRQTGEGRIPSPAIGNVFRALYAVPPPQVKAVILGQDPAPQKGQATGLSFSLMPGTLPASTPSVQRVMLEAENEGICMNMNDGDLSSWARSGTLMLNMALTLPCPSTSNECQIGAHLPLWTDLTLGVIDFVEKQPQAISYLLWGAEAGQVQMRIHASNHHAFLGGHPSPNAPGSHFFCRNYFKCANAWLETHGSTEVAWSTASQCAPQTPCVWAKGNPPQCEQACVPASCQI